MSRKLKTPGSSILRSTRSTRAVQPERLARPLASLLPVEDGRDAVDDDVVQAARVAVRVGVVAGRVDDRGGGGGGAVGAGAGAARAAVVGADRRAGQRGRLADRVFPAQPALLAHAAAQDHREGAVLRRVRAAWPLAPHRSGLRAVAAEG